MNVTVFGAGGRTGRRVVDEALARGHTVTAVVRRPPTRPFDDQVRVSTGDARERATVAAATAGADAVLSVMGPVGDDPGTAYSEAVANLAAAMEETGPRRLVITANARVLDDRPLAGAYAAVSEEHRRARAILDASRLEWTVVAAPLLRDDDDGGGHDEYVATLDARGDGRDVGRAGLARAVVDALDRPAWIGRIVDVAD